MKPENLKNKWERKKISIDETEEIIRLFKEAVFSFSCSKRYNKKIICDYNLQFDTELNLGEDSCFALSYLVHCENVEVIISCDYHYVRYNHETLSTAVMSIESIQNIEFLNNKVSDLLVPILGNKAENTMCMRMGIFYKSILGKILNNQEKCNYKFIKELYGQYWFGKVLERLDEVFFDESCKLKIVLKTKSALVFWIFLRMHNKRKSFLYTLKSKRN